MDLTIYYGIITRDEYKLKFMIEQNNSKYKLLQKYLLSLNKSEIELSFEEIEDILGFKLQESSKNYQVWWNWTPKTSSNDKEEHPHAKNWNAIGWYAKLKSQSVLFINRYYISDNELKQLSLSVPEVEFYQNYLRKHVYKVDISVDDWLKLLDEKKVFSSENIEFIKKIYLSPNHATTCYSLSILEETATSSYNSPVISLAKRILREQNLPQLYREDGRNTFWPYIFWGKYVDNNKHFEWLLRPELVVALRMKFPFLENQEGNRFLDEQLNNEITSSPIPEKIEEETTKPKKKVETIFTNSHEGYPRSRNVTYFALDKVNYTCEFNTSHQSFINKATGKKYMEAHHLIPLAFHKSFENSLDHIANVICLCSECHNRIHYGIDADLLITKFYNERKERLEEAGIGISLERLLEMYKNNN